MIISSETEIAAPPIKVWRALCDFQAYRRWNPYREVIGVAGLGAKVILMIGPDPEQRRRLPARISVFEPGHRLGFATGRPLLGRALESFIIEPGRRGTRLLHTAEMSGLGALLFTRPASKSNLQGVYRRVDDALAKFVESGSRGQPSAKGRRGRAA